MQFKTFKTYIVKIVTEGNRLQKHNINGKSLTNKSFTTMQVVSLIIASVSLKLLPTGFSDNFAGYIISFLGIFIGLFTSIIISMMDKSKSMFEKYDDKNALEKTQTRQLRNYLVQFTGLTSYSIFLAIILIILLSLVLLHNGFKSDIWNNDFVKHKEEINLTSVFLFFKRMILIVHRFFIVYYLLNFFIITIFSITSYFSFLLTEYNKLKPKND